MLLLVAMPFAPSSFLVQAGVECFRLSGGLCALQREVGQSQGSAEHVMLKNGVWTSQMARSTFGV